MIAGLLALTLALAPSDEIVIKDGLAITSLLQSGRMAVSIDPIFSSIARGIMISPKKGETITLDNGRKSTWSAVTADKEGMIDGDSFRGGYFYSTVDVPVARTMLLEAVGHGLVYVNGVPHAGDPYGYGYLRVPIALNAGVNRFLFASGRGPIRAKLIPINNVSIELVDATMPDLVSDKQAEYWAGVTVINPSDRPLARYTVEAEVEGCGMVTESPSVIPPLSTRKVAIKIACSAGMTGETAKCRVRLLIPGSSKPVSTHDFDLRLRKPNQTRRVTFISKIDGSVQYYGLNPSQKPDKSNTLILSTHGASVEAMGQADAYASKDWATLVAATNRRPYGFDWEDWGRLDALEVLELAKKTYPYDSQHVVLTGHSMGGHGTWHLGVTYPDLFAAIGPSAGWSSFFSYGGSRRISDQDGVAKILAKAMSPSDTLKLVTNTLQQHVYILHGDKDDNVPPEEARLMRDALKAINHPNLGYFEQPGAGHWWGTEQGPGFGSACVDWKPMMELFQKVRIPKDKDVKAIDFTTANPGISARNHWITIEQQLHSMDYSRVQIKREGTKLVGTTQNVATLSFDLRAIGMPSSIELDGQTVPITLGGEIGNALTVTFKDNKWQMTSLKSGAKSPSLSGPFKLAFKDRMVFLYATKGRPEENEWAFNKARYDAEMWQYRGNGAVDVLPDTTELNKLKGRNLILYGNSVTNSAWSTALKGCPITVDRTQIKAGKQVLKGDTLGLIMVYPRADSKGNLVGVFSGTGVPGMRSVERLSVFSAGTALPDWMVVGVDILQKGIQGVRGAGYFGNDWKLESGDFAWRE